MHREKWNKRYAAEQGNEVGQRSGAGQPSEILQRETELLSPGKALVLAAGTGRNANYLADLGWDVTAVDFSDVAVKQGAALSREKALSVSWLQKDLLSYQPERESVDLLTLFYLHMPMDDLSLVIQRGVKALKPGGRILIVGHHSSNITEGSGGPQNPDVLYTPEDLLPYLSGLKVIRAEGERHPVDHGGAAKGAMQIDCVVVAEKRA
jgi:SAM-dependent methyltransferase